MRMIWTISFFTSDCLMLNSDYRNVEYDLVFENLSIISAPRFEVKLLANTLCIKTWNPTIDHFDARALNGYKAMAEAYIKSADEDIDDVVKHSRED